MKAPTGKKRATAGVTALRLVHAVWGFPQNLAGGVVALATMCCPHRIFRTALVTEWPLDRGLSLGIFVFVPAGCARRLLVHEYGHCVQSLVLGPLYMPLVVLPSLVWAGFPIFERLRRSRTISYYDMPIEHWADVWGERLREVKCECTVQDGRCLIPTCCPGSSDGTS